MPFCLRVKTIRSSNPAHLINLGTERWAFKPELGLSRPWKKNVIDFYGGAWIFADNHHYQNGSTRHQNKIGTAQAHISYNFLRSLWAAFDSTYYAGGRPYINGIKSGIPPLGNSRTWGQPLLFLLKDKTRLNCPIVLEQPPVPALITGFSPSRTNSAGSTRIKPRVGSKTRTAIRLVDGMPSFFVFPYGCVFPNYWNNYIILN